MRVIALRNQIARADVKKEAAEQRERDAEAIDRQAEQPGRGDAGNGRRRIEEQPAERDASARRDS